MAYYPGQRVRHKAPRRLTLPKLLFGLALVAAVYFGFAFVPPYWRYYRADTVMAERAGQTLSMRRQQDDLADLRMKVRQSVARELLQLLRIPRRDLYVDVRTREGDRYLQVEARWTDYAIWPFVGKRTPLRFSKRIEMKTR